MANLNEVSNFDEGVYQIEIEDFIEGGSTGIHNRPIKSLTNRTRWLKNKLESIWDDMPVASISVLGGIRIGRGIKMEANGICVVDIDAVAADLANHYYTKTAADQRFLDPSEIKTVNGQSLIGQGNVEISGGGGGGAVVQNPYNLPVASGTTLGGIKVGSNLTISPDGTLSATVPTSGGGGTAPSPVLPSASDLFPIGSYITVSPWNNNQMVALANTTFSFGQIVNWSNAAMNESIMLSGGGHFLGTSTPLPTNMQFMIRGYSGYFIRATGDDNSPSESVNQYLAIRIS